PTWATAGRSSRAAAADRRLGRPGGASASGSTPRAAGSWRTVRWSGGSLLSDTRMASGAAGVALHESDSGHQARRRAAPDDNEHQPPEEPERGHGPLQNGFERGEDRPLEDDEDEERDDLRDQAVSQRYV